MTHILLGIYQIVTGVIGAIVCLAFLSDYPEYRKHE